MDTTKAISHQNELMCDMTSGFHEKTFSHII